ncbi:Alpha-ketoglutarate-dependent dioxygenase alkB-like protein 6 [Tolypocladium paradoxum]|uniref:Alpha-ketoglutarate-dependent dioxygenase alkB-like protein 6 n=1 Tax=Tolypocladium paradoxum TaxID=94208 RepID=A0A2S4KTG6_9HYPO|nr:Alpha-ketoglutarate-dependent dioxygenase alkB-like protein 6 [Tolypocladium paradoxum]
MDARDASLPPSLEHARVQGLPSAAYYIPDFISEDEERLILSKIAAAPKPRWKQLTHRRLQTWPSDLVQDRLLDAPLPPWLEDPVVARLLSLPLSEGSYGHVFEQSPHARPNHVLINDKDDGALDPTPVWRILQEPRSLLITTESLYTDYLHGIADIDEDVDLSADGGVVNWGLLRSPDAYADGRNVRGTRTSLTYRDVLKVSKVGNRLAMFAKR